MAGLIREKVFDSLKVINKMIDACDSSDIVHFNQVIEIKKYFKDCKMIFKRAVLMSNKEIFNAEELKDIKVEIGSVENKIRNITSKIN